MSEKKTIHLLGIDPGKTGALCVLDMEKGSGMITNCCFVDWPKTDAVIDLITDMGHEFDPEEISLARLEKVHSMPRDGSASAFSFGANFGIWIGILTTMRIPLEMVTPQQWMKELSIPLRKTVHTKNGDVSVIKSKSDNKIRNYQKAVEIISIHADTKQENKILQKLKGPKGGLYTGRIDSFLIAFSAF